MTRFDFAPRPRTITSGQLLQAYNADLQRLARVLGSVRRADDGALELTHGLRVDSIGAYTPGGAIGIGSELELSAGLSARGAHFDTDTGASPVWITRNGDETQGLKISADDRNLYLDYLEDVGEGLPGSWHLRSGLDDGSGMVEWLTVDTNGRPIFPVGAAVAAAQRAYLDGGGDTYLVEAAGDRVELYVNGIMAAEFGRAGTNNRLGLNTYPTANATYQLGAAALRWLNVFSVDGDYSNDITVGRFAQFRGGTGVALSSAGQIGLAGTTGAPFLSWHNAAGARIGYIQVSNGIQMRIRSEVAGGPILLDADSTEIASLHTHGVQTTTGIRATGWFGATNVSGLALEVGISGGAGHVMTYNRSTASYGELNLGKSGDGLKIHSSGTAQFGQAMRVTGTATTGFTSDAGVELFYTTSSGGYGGVQAYDRTAATYKKMEYRGQPIVIAPAGQEKVTVATRNTGNNVSFALSDYVENVNAGCWTMIVVVDGWAAAQAFAPAGGGNPINGFDPYVKFTNVGGSANKVNIYWTGAEYRIENKSGAVRQITFTCYQ